MTPIQPPDHLPPAGLPATPPLHYLRSSSGAPEPSGLDRWDAPVDRWLGQLVLHMRHRRADVTTYSTLPAAVREHAASGARGLSEVSLWLVLLLGLRNGLDLAGTSTGEGLAGRVGLVLVWKPESLQVVLGALEEGMESLRRSAIAGEVR